MRIASASEQVLARFSCRFFGVLVCRKSVFSDGQDVKYDRDITPHQHLFHGTNSHEAAKVVRTLWQKMGISKETESERISDQSRRASQCS